MSYTRDRKDFNFFVYVHYSYILRNSFVISNAISIFMQFVGVDINQLIISVSNNKTALQSNPDFTRIVHAKRGNNSSINHLRSNLVRNREFCPKFPQ